MKRIVIVSGGMDSVTLLHYLVRVQQQQVAACVTFLYNQRHVREVDCAAENAAMLGIPHVVIDLTEQLKFFGNVSSMVNGSVEVPDLEEVLGDPQPSTYVPNRNMLFLSFAAALAESVGAQIVSYGAQMHDVYGYWDTTKDFLDAMNNVLRLNRGEGMRIEAPFVNKSKTDVLGIGLNLAIDYGKTWSCYKGGETPCGTCATCAERARAFAAHGVLDPLIG